MTIIEICKEAGGSWVLTAGAPVPRGSLPDNLSEGRTISCDMDTPDGMYRYWLIAERTAEAMVVVAIA
jgi:hypothetical protein